MTRKCGDLTGYRKWALLSPKTSLASAATNFQKSGVKADV